MVLTETPPLTRPAEPPDRVVARMRRLLDVSVALNAVGDPDRLLDLIARTTTDVLDCEAASILLFEEATGALRFVAATGEAGAALVGAEVPIRGSLAGATFLDDRIVHAADAAADDRHHAATDAETGFATRTLLGVPMRVDGRPVGVLQALNARGGRFDRADAEALLIVASQAAVAIRNARADEALREAHAKLAGLDRLKSDFMAIVSHELRTPLTAVRGFGQILAEEADGDHGAMAVSILRAGDRMMDLVETLDVMASLDEDLGRHPGTPVSLAAVLGAAADAAAPHAERALPDGPLVVEGDAERLRLAFENVLRNAVQFSGGGPVRLAAEVAHGEVRLAVADEGRGLAPADLERVFEPYVQVACPDRRDHEGLGVGLTVARAVVREHGGSLWIESDGPGAGCTVRARLPLAGATDGG